MEGKGRHSGTPLSKNTLDLRPEHEKSSPQSSQLHPKRHHHQHHLHHAPRPAHHPAERTRAAETAVPEIYLAPQINLAIRRRRARKAATITIVTAMFLFGVVEVSAFWPHSSKVAHLPAAAASAAPAATLPDTKAAPQVSEQQQLQQFVDSYVAAQPGPYAVEIKDLATGAIATTRPNEAILSASLYKLFVAQMVYERIAQGRIEMTDTVAGESVKTCLSNMITWSDNTCGEALGTLIGWGSVNGELHADGYTSTTLAYPQHTSVADVTLLLQRVNDGTFVDGNSSQEMYTLLSEQQVNNRLPAELPGVKIAHKTGDLYSYEHDAGIVDGPHGKYIISVMTGPWPDLSQAAPSIAEFSKQAYQFFQTH
jgi:beta-lactamase class A